MEQKAIYIGTNGQYIEVQRRIAKMKIYDANDPDIRSIVSKFNLSEIVIHDGKIYGRFSTDNICIIKFINELQMIINNLHKIDNED